VLPITRVDTNLAILPNRGLIISYRLLVANKSIPEYKSESWIDHFGRKPSVIIDDLSLNGSRVLLTKNCCVGLLDRTDFPLEATSLRSSTQLKRPDNRAPPSCDYGSSSHSALHLDKTRKRDKRRINGRYDSRYLWLDWFGPDGLS
jgi:hypothetical protein